MNIHLDQVIQQGGDEFKGITPQTPGFRALHAHVVDMADMMSAGIIQQFRR